MKRLLFCALLLTTLYALICGATDTRVLTLGENNVILRDDANIFLFPQTIVMYRGLAVADVNAADNYYRLGAHYDLGQDNGVIGVYVDSRNLPVSAFLNGHRPLQNSIGNRLNAFYGRAFGEMDFGVNLFMFHNAEDHSSETPAGPKGSNTELGLNVGLTLMKNLELALGFAMDSWTNQDANGNDITKPKGNMILDVNGRYWWAFNNDVDFVPHLMFGIFNEGWTDETASPVVENTDKTMFLSVGWGVNIRPVDRVLLLFDLGVNYSSSKVTLGTNPEVKTTDMHLPYYKVGLEGHVTRWWDIRLGAVKSWDAMKVVDTKYGQTSTATYLGSGFHFGNLTLDAYLNPNFALNGPYFVSGATTPLAYQASILYTWK